MVGARARRRAIREATKKDTVVTVAFWTTVSVLAVVAIVSELWR